MSDLLYSDTEEALRDSVRRLFADRCPAESVMSAYDAAPQDFSNVWHALAADLGMAGLLVPEEFGGAGAGAREAAVVMEEIGRAVAPVPFLSSAVLATVALLEAGDTETVKGLAAGSLTAVLTVPLSTAPDDAVGGVDTSGSAPVWAAASSAILSANPSSTVRPALRAGSVTIRRKSASVMGVTSIWLRPIRRASSGCSAQAP